MTDWQAQEHKKPRGFPCIRKEPALIRLCLTLFRPVEAFFNSSYTAFVPGMMFIF
jgi:hypothetical protein